MRTFFAFAMLVACLAAWGQEQSVTAPRLLRAQELLAPVDQAALDRQYFALRRMTLEAVEYSPRGPIASVVGQTGIVLPANISGREKGDSATDLLPLIKDLLLASGGESLSVEENSGMYGTGTSLRLSQSIRGVPVVNGVVSMSYNAETRRVSGLVAHFVPDRNLPRAPKLSAEEAQDILRQAVEKAEGTKADISEGAYLAYFAEFNDPSPPQLVWAIRATTAESDHMYFVDAATGLVTSRSSMRIRLTRKVYDANNNFLPKLPQGLPTQSLDATQIAAQLYRSTPNNYVQNADDILRLKIPNSIPQFPSTVNIVVRNGQSSGGSYHTRAGTQDYISLPGSLSGSHTHAGLVDDIVVHEFAHAIGVRTFPYAGDDSREWAALHESYSDAAATVVDIAKHGGPSDLTWTIADGFFTDGDGLRSMKNPFNELSVRDFGNDWYPNYIFGPEWEHVNSGIISHAYYLMVNGGQHARWTDAL